MRRRACGADGRQRDEEEEEEEEVAVAVGEGGERGGRRGGLGRGSAGVG